MNKCKLIKIFISGIKDMFSDIFSKDKNRIKRQIPNILTMFRGFFAPIFIIISIIINSINLTFFVIFISALTDSYDGYYARKNGYVSEFGALIDTICDKMFILFVILPIFNLYSKYFIIIIIIELLISVHNTIGRAIGINITSSKIGKVKTFILDLLIVLVYFSKIISISNIIILINIYITIFAQILTLFGYIIFAIRYKRD